MWSRRRPRPLILEWQDWEALATMVMGNDAKLERIMDELEVDDGEEGN